MFYNLYSQSAPCSSCLLDHNFRGHRIFCPPLHDWYMPIRRKIQEICIVINPKTVDEPFEILRKTSYDQ